MFAISGALAAQTPTSLLPGPSVAGLHNYPLLGPLAEHSQCVVERSTTVASYLLFTPDFSFSISDPQTIDPAVTNMAQFTYSVTFLGGFSSTVSLAVDNTVYNFASPYLAPSSFSSSGNGTLSLILPAGVTPGTYTVTLHATGGGISHDASTTLTILDDSCC